jgi:two-component system, NarL family, nitrate/nitrite response regulator NarL
MQRRGHGTGNHRRRVGRAGEPTSTGTWHVTPGRQGVIPPPGSRSIEESAVASIVVVDDHGLFAQTVAIALRSCGSKVRVLEPTPPDMVISAVTTEPTELILLDPDPVEAGDADGLVGDLTHTGIPVLMVTGVQDPVRRARCIVEGAVGVIDKTGSFDELLDGIDQVLATGTLLTSCEYQEHLDLLRAHERSEQIRFAPFASLSCREAEVLGELMLGRTVDQIAAASFVTLATVRTQVRAIRGKLGVSTQIAAIARARAAGWVPPQERESAPR